MRAPSPRQRRDIAPDPVSQRTGRIDQQHQRNAAAAVIKPLIKAGSASATPVDSSAPKSVRLALPSAHESMNALGEGSSSRRDQRPLSARAAVPLPPQTVVPGQSTAPATGTKPHRGKGNAPAAVTLAPQTAKQAAEQQRRSEREQRRFEAEQKAKQVENIRERAAELETENVRLLEQVTIWKNAQTAASSFKDEIDRMRNRHVELRREIALQAATIEKLKRDKVDMVTEMKRLQSLAKDAERNRGVPSVVPTGSPSSSASTMPIYETVVRSQKQVLGAQIIQRDFRAFRQHRAEAHVRVEAAKRKALRAFAQGAGGHGAAAAAAATAAVHTSEKASSPSAPQRLKAKQKEKERKDRKKKLEMETSTAEELYSRFITCTSSLRFGLRTLNDHAGGLESLIGAPSADVHNAMEREHADETPFHSFDVRNTNPRREFLYVTEMKVGELPDRLADAPTARQGWRLADFVACDPARAAGLSREEVIALRLHTGPMHMHYSIRNLRHSMGSGCYVTTIHALNSGVVKLSAQTRTRTVYRAVSGGMLPQAFFDPDEDGNIGGVEIAFLSTTTDRTLALMHERSTREEQRLRPSMLFQIKIGLADKSADVEWVSQRPAEKEVVRASALRASHLGSAPSIFAFRMVADTLFLRRFSHQKQGLRSSQSHG